MSHGRSEPAGLHGLGKQVTEVKEGFLEIRKKKPRIYASVGRRRRKGLQSSIERKSHAGFFFLRAFKGVDFRGGP